MKIVRPPTLIAFLLIGLQLSASPGFAQSADLILTAEEQAWIREHPTIRVHNEMGWPPFNFNVDGEPVGFSIDYMNLLADEVGLDVEFVSGPTWSEFLDMMRSGDLDVMLNIVETPARKEFLLYTDLYSLTLLALAVQEQSPDVRSLGDLTGRTICIPSGSSMHEILGRRYPEIDLLPLNDTTACLHAVADGRVFASLEGFSVLRYLLRDSRLPGLRISNITYDADMASVMHIATRRDLPVLRDILQKGMHTLDTTELARIRNKWLARDATETDMRSPVILSAEEQAWLEEHPVIRVHNEMAWPPHNFNVDGRPTGFSIDYMNLVAKEAGFDVEYISGPNWDEFKVMIKSGELDVMLNMSIAPDRQEYVNFTRPYTQIAIAVIVKDPGIKIRSFDDLRGLKVSATRGFSTEEYLTQKYPDVELILEDDLLGTLYAVLEGRADATMDDFAALNYLMQQQGLPGLHVAFLSNNPEIAERPAIGVRKDWPILRDILQKAMDSLDEAEVNELRRKWLGVDKEVVPADEARNTVWWLVGGVLGLFLLLMLLNVVSRRFSPDAGAVLQTGTLRFRIVIFGSLSIFVVLVAIVGWFALERINEKILRDVNNNLGNVLLTTTERLELWVDQQIAVLAQIARNPVLIQQTEELLGVASNPEALLSSDALRNIRSTLAQSETDLGLGFFIIDRNGVSIGSARETNIGTRNLIAEQRPELLDRVYAGEAAFVPPISSDVAIGDRDIESTTSLFIAVPIRRNGGDVIAALTMRLDPAEGFSRVLQFSRVGESGESYAFDQTGTLISASRFEADLRGIHLLDEGESSIMKIQIRDPGGNLTEGFRSDLPRAEQPLTLMAESAIAASADTRQQRSLVQENMDGYRDYRGVSVYGAWLWDGQLGLGLTSEIDVAEAMSTFTIVRLTSFGVLGVTLVLSLGGILFVLVTGERTNKALIRARDELEDRVEERTRDLNEATEQYSSLVENIPGVVYRFRIDENRTTIFFSEHFVVLTGYPAKDFMSGKMHFGELIHPDDQEPVSKNLDDAFAAKRPFEHEFRIIDRAGNTRWVSSHGMAIYDSDGNPEFADGTMFDVTERIRLEHELAKAHERMTEELNVGRDIQMSMLPLEFPAFPDRQEFDIYALLQPAREVGGDFYDFFFINDRELCLIVGDVSGKGVPAALFMAVTKTMLKARAIDDPSPASVVTRVNNELSADNPASMFVTLFMAIVDVRSGEMRFTNAGHNPPYILRKSAGFECLNQRHGPIIGAVEGVAFKESESQLSEGDSVFIFTDGVTEAMDVSGQLFSEGRLEKFLKQANCSPAEQLTQDTVAAVEDFATGAEQADDITILTFTLQQSAETLDQQQLEITIKADMSEIVRVNAVFSEYAEKVGLSTAVVQKVSISFDELLTNIVSYGFDDPEGHVIDIAVMHTNGRLVITVTDDGVPFNPFDRVGPDTTLSLEEREIGGLGVLLVVELMDECTYQRLRDKNVVTLTMSTET